MVEKDRTFIRVGLLSSTFFNIAIDCVLDYKKHFLELDKVKSEGGEFIENIFIYKRNDDFEFYSEMLRRDTIKIIIFLCTFLESYIFDFAGIMLGDNYTKSHLEKLDTISKWILIPKLITGHEIDKSKSYYSRLKNLVMWRNKIIHSKSKDGASILNNERDNLITDFENFKPIYELVEIGDFLTMVNDLFKELDIFDENGFHYMYIENGLNKIK